MIKIMTVSRNMFDGSLRLCFYELIRTSTAELMWKEDKPFSQNIKQDIKKWKGVYFYMGRSLYYGECLPYNEAPIAAHPVTYPPHIYWNKPLVTIKGVAGELIRTKPKGVFSRVVRLSDGTIINYKEDGTPWGYPSWEFTIKNK